MREVVYVTAGRWPGTLVIVTERRAWGVVGYMAFTDKPSIEPARADGKAFVRVPTENFIKVGEIPDEDPQG